MAALRIIIALAIAIPGFVSAASSDGTDKVNCTLPEYSTKINETLQNAKQCFKNLVNTEIGVSVDKSDRSCNSVDGFKTSAIMEFLNATKQCQTSVIDGHKTLTQNLDKFVNVVNLTLGNGHYKSFVANKGVECVNKNVRQISECVRNATFAKNATLHSTLRLGSFGSINADAGCPDVVKIKKCTMHQFSRSLCSNQSIEFVEYLFNTTEKEFCPNTTTSDENPNESGSSSQIQGSFINVFLTSLAFWKFYL